MYRKKNNEVNIRYDRHILKKKNPTTNENKKNWHRLHVPWLKQNLLVSINIVGWTNKCCPIWRLASKSCPLSSVKMNYWVEFFLLCVCESVAQYEINPYILSSVCKVCIQLRCIQQIIFLFEKYSRQCDICCWFSFIHYSMNILLPL